MPGNKIFYHGSRIKGLKVLEPRLDQRLGVVGLFVSDEPFGPMMFSLLPDRTHTSVDYKTKNGKFIKGKVITPFSLNKEGWLYEIKPDIKWMRERDSGRYYLVKKVPVVNCSKVQLTDVTNLNWKIEVKEQLLKKEFGIKVIYEAEDFIVINKPAGILVHGHGPSLIDWLLEHYPESENVGDDPQNRPGIVHRLDKDTSGVLLICRNQRAFDYFKKMFQERSIKKSYIALVFGVPKEKQGVIDKAIGLKGGTVKRTVHVKEAKLTKNAVTKYNVLKKVGNELSLLEVEPLTGRTHQIRVHLASIGHPIVGDKLYGGKNKVASIERQFLHAKSLEFLSPKGERLKIETDLPEELENFLQGLARN